jgi:type II secretory pathway pseudopilin PulG
MEGSTIIGIIVGVLIVGGLVALVALGFRYSRLKQEEDIDPVMARLAEATQRGEAVSL